VTQHIVEQLLLDDVLDPLSKTLDRATGLV
jgi:hypothetical protein